MSTRMFFLKLISTQNIHFKLQPLCYYNGHQGFVTSYPKHASCFPVIVELCTLTLTKTSKAGSLLHRSDNNILLDILLEHEHGIKYC